MRAVFLIRAFVAMLVLVTSVGTGVARGTLPPAGAIVICNGHGSATILIDAAGNEVTEVALCGEAANGLFTQEAVTPESPVAAWSREPLARPAVVLAVLAPVTIGVSGARAPPVTV
ncbi:MAG: hypothetical protein AAFO58_06585 [Pseudomonadota bacterium]